MNEGCYSIIKKVSYVWVYEYTNILDGSNTFFKANQLENKIKDLYNITRLRIVLGWFGIRLRFDYGIGIIVEVGSKTYV